MSQDIENLKERLQECADFIAKFSGDVANKSVLTTETLKQLTIAIKQTNENVEEIKNKNLDLENRLQSIEEKLNFLSNNN